MMRFIAGILAGAIGGFIPQWAFPVAPRFPAPEIPLKVKTPPKEGYREVAIDSVWFAPGMDFAEHFCIDNGYTIRGDKLTRLDDPGHLLITIK